MVKGEIAHYEQFLLFPQCFQKACFPEASKGVIVWEWVKQHSAYFIHITAIAHTLGLTTVFPLTSQLGGGRDAPLTSEKWGYKKQNRDTKRTTSITPKKYYLPKFSDSQV